MARTVGDRTTPLGRTVTPTEVAALRGAIRQRLGDAGVTTVKQWAVFVAIAAAAAGLDWLMNRRPWLFLQAELLVLVIFVVVALVHSRRLLALSTLDTLVVHRAELVVDPNGYAQLDTREGHRLHQVTSTAFLSPDQVDPPDLVRTRRGGPEEYFVLAATPVRPSTEEERKALEAFLWRVRVYHNDKD